jgi:hypothetical protein
MYILDDLEKALKKQAYNKAFDILRELTDNLTIQSNDIVKTIDSFYSKRKKNESFNNLIQALVYSFLEKNEFDVIANMIHLGMYSSTKLTSLFASTYNETLLDYVLAHDINLFDTNTLYATYTDFLSESKHLNLFKKLKPHFPLSDVQLRRVVQHAITHENLDAIEYLFQNEPNIMSHMIDRMFRYADEQSYRDAQYDFLDKYYTFDKTYTFLPELYQLITQYHTFETNDNIAFYFIKPLLYSSSVISLIDDMGKILDLTYGNYQKPIPNTILEKIAKKTSNRPELMIFYEKKAFEKTVQFDNPNKSHKMKI